MGRKKKQEDDTDKESYVGRRVEKNFEGFGKYVGSVVAYNAARGFYKVVYDDGDREELELHELELILVHVEAAAHPSGKRGRPSKEKSLVDEPDSKRQRRQSSSKQNTPATRKKDGGDSTRINRQRPLVQKRRDCDENDKDDGDVKGDTPCVEEDRENGAVGRLDGKGEPPSVRTLKRKRQRQDCASTLPPAKPNHTSARGRGIESQNLLQGFEAATDGDGSSDFDDESDRDEDEEMSSYDEDCMPAALANVPDERNLPLPVPLPTSSRSFPLSEDLVAEAFAAYSFLRSFSHAIFLSPFSFDDFVSALIVERANHLMDSIHLILLQALRRHLQRLSKDDCKKARECLRQLDWNLLDNVTWPSFLMVFLVTQGFGKSYGQRIGSLRLLDAEYYKVTPKVKLAVLSFLCDHALETEEIRAVLDVRELEFESQLGQKDFRCFNSKVIDGQEGQQALAIKEHRMKVSDDTIQETSTLSTGILNVDPKLVQEETFPDGNSDECVLCGMNGNLICCDGCPAAYHSRCVGIARASLPPGDWFCPECIVEKVGGEQSRRMRGLEGCHSLGVDPFGRTFIVTCGHLLVLSPSDSTQFNYNYYNKHDILQVIQTLEGQAPFCTDVALAIRQYWNIPSEKVALLNNLQAISEPAKAILSEGQSKTEQFTDAVEPPVLQEFNKMIKTEHKDTNKTPLVTNSESSSGLSRDEDATKGLGLPVVSKESAGQLTETDHASQNEISQQVAFDFQTPLSSSSIPNGRPTLCESKASEPFLDTPSTLPLNAVFTSVSKALEGTSLSAFEEPPAVTPLSVQSQPVVIQGVEQDPYLAQKLVDRDSKGRFLTASSREQLLCDSVQKLAPQEHLRTDKFVRISSYINHYVFGDAAATAAANLALMDADETGPPEKGTRKLRKTGTTIAEQINAFCKAPPRFCWPSLRRKLMEAPKDRCGWCFSCTSCMKRGCLLNQAASQIAAGAARISGGIRPGKYGYGHLPAVIGYILYMEEVLQSFLMGPWENLMFRKQWRKKLEQAMSIGDVKASLLDLEENLRSVVLTEDWSKCLEDAPSMVLGGSPTSLTDDSLTKKASGRKGSRRSGASRQGLPKSGNTTLGNVQWTRRGKFAHRVAGWATLSSKVARKAGRKGGLKNITGIAYVDSEEVPRRTKQTAWRARVQAARTVAELALQVRCLDCMLRWDDLSSKPEVHSVSKVGEEEGSEESITFGVHGKSIQDNLLIYLIDSTLVPRQSIRQNAPLPGLPPSCEGQVWVEERQLPLHLLKEFEEKERMSKQSQAPKLIQLQKYLSEVKKAPKRDIYKFLWERAGFSTPTKLVMSILCKFCSSKVLASLAVQCHLCKEPFHKECTVASHAFGMLEMKHTCCSCLKQLAQKKAFGVKSEPGVSSQKQGNENSQPAMIPPTHQKRIVICQPRPQPFSKLSLKLPLKASPLGSQVKEESKTGGSQGSFKEALPKNVEKSSEGGVYWRKNGTRSRMRFERNMLFPIQGEPCTEFPKCYVCKQQFKGDLIYIKCEFCPLWFHGDAVGVTKSTLDEVLGFKCNKCRKKAVPSCPYGIKCRVHKRVAQGPLPPCNAPLPAMAERSTLVQEACITKRSPLPTLRLAQPQQQTASSPVATPEMVTIKPLEKCRPYVNGYPQPGSERFRLVEGPPPSKPLHDRHRLENPSLLAEEPTPLKHLHGRDRLESHSQPRRGRFQQLVEDSTPFESRSQPSPERFRHLVEDSTPLEPLVDKQPLENGPAPVSPLSIEQCVEEDLFDNDLDARGDIDCALSEDGQILSAGDETRVQDDMMEGGSLNEETSVQPTLSFMELLSSEDNRVEELAEVAMDFGADGFDVFDLDTILGDFGSSGLGLEPLAEDVGTMPESESQTVAQSLDAAVDTMDEVCPVCGDGSQPFDLQCIRCGLAVHQHCLNGGASGAGTWISHGWACDACKAGMSPSQDVLAGRMPLVDSRILLKS